ncbi:unnamed protein product [Fasciola hepatica]|uniref:Uncharacterized protein n=1 Tax=Fasciola hepatica TaxID=6192 RepID=A0ABC9HI77_FASHE|nr:unnamed protein product [Fasciola hepatica]
MRTVTILLLVVICLRGMNTQETEANAEQSTVTTITSESNKQTSPQSTGSTGAASVPGTISTPASTVSTQRASTTGGSMRLLVHATGWILPLITGTALF